MYKCSCGYETYVPVNIKSHMRLNPSHKLVPHDYASPSLFDTGLTVGIAAATLIDSVLDNSSSYDSSSSSNYSGGGGDFGGGGSSGEW